MYYFALTPYSFLPFADSCPFRWLLPFFISCSPYSLCLIFHSLVTTQYLLPTVHLFLIVLLARYLLHTAYPWLFTTYPLPLSFDPCFLFICSSQCWIILAPHPSLLTTFCSLLLFTALSLPLNAASNFSLGPPLSVNYVLFLVQGLLILLMAWWGSLSSPP